MPVILRIESIGGGRAGGRGGGGGGWEAEGGLKQPFGLKLCPQYGTQTGRIHKGGQDCREEQPGTPCSPINALQSHEMHPGGLTASVKSRADLAIYDQVLGVSG